MANHDLSYVVPGTPAECVRYTLEEMLWLVDIGVGDILSDTVKNEALSQADHVSFAISYLNNNNVSRLWDQFRFVRSQWDTKFVMPSDWYGGMTDDDLARREANYNKERTPEQHYHWAFIESWRPHPTKGDGWSLI